MVAHPKFSVHVIAENRNRNFHQVSQIIKNVFPTAIEPGSIADRLLTQGREEGRKEGREEGKLIGRIQTLQEMLGEQVTSDDKLKELDLATLRQRSLRLQLRLRQL
ncbi:MAG TPA: hypothetical protein DDZ51_18680 [Planctomycetaceae bacterium]|nr:hypothetical protein [Planctomycetaceae bacterium]